nr:type IX secretion system sortase PorU [Prevotella sp.]
VTTYASFDSYTKAAEQTYTCYIDNLNVGNNTVSITKNSGGNLRLDYLSLACTTPQAAPDLTATQWPTPQYLYNISNQDHHADEACDMVIIIPTSQSWRSQAERLKTLHEERDGLSVRIVPADELYNEFSSGTPDASAYKRYMKMLYDRAASDAQLPRYLLLFGDGAWDNRMRSSAWSGYSPDDFLLCYESDNSFSEIYCYVSDDFFCLLDDEEEIQQGSNYLGKPDVAVGRLSARTLEEATILVDKIESYTSNEAAGSWQNTLCFMGDDGNNNAHMLTADKVATMAETNYPGYTINKIYWDAYERVASSTGHSFPAVTQLIKEQMQKGALLMNYSGHGAAYAFSHELVVQLADFAETTSMRLPLWVTASCDIMPFDGQEDNIGETAMLNRQGGSIAFFGTTRTVYANYNEMINLMFTEYVLGSIDGKRTSIGEAARLAKCDLVSSGRDTSPNKLQYTLLGDPALVLATPTQQVVIDSINGVAVANSTQRLAAGSIARMAGHVVTADASYTDAAATAVDSNFRGTVTATVRDAEETITCRLNNTDSDGAETPFVYKDRTKTIYQGSDSIRNGRFALTFAVPKDISYTDGKGLLTLYALDNEKTREAHGQDDSFVLNGTAIAGNDSIGPSIYCYLNTPSFVNGGQTNTSPYFVAELYDANGINASGSSVGHDLELIIDGKMATTYNLNAYFTYDFGDYRRGSVGYSIPALDYGWHSLLFRAWDVLNNSSTAALDFEVAKGLAPNCVSVSATRNPTSGTTTFIITHDRAGCQLDVELDIFDTAGRQLYKRTESGTPTGDTYTLSWDLTTGSGQPLQTGVYLYRVSISSDGSSQSSMAKKLIIVKH